jgi:chitodextrinase
VKKLILVIGVLLYGSIASAQTTYNLAWDDSPSSGVQGYYLYVGLQPGSYSQQIDAGNGTTWQITLSPGTHYLIVRAYGGANLSSPSNELIITVPTTDTTAPTAPNSISATVASTTQINVSWSASSDNVAVTHYRVERCVGSGCTAFAQIATPIATSYSNSGLTATTTYRYRVRAADAAGNLSSYSAIATATTNSPSSPQDPCAADPLRVTVTRWPTNAGGRNLQYTSSHQIANSGVAFGKLGKDLTSITFTDVRGCTTTVNR